MIYNGHVKLCITMNHYMVHNRAGMHQGWDIPSGEYPKIQWVFRNYRWDTAQHKWNEQHAVIPAPNGMRMSNKRNNG